MKSPFPGMDPYMEHHWGDVHQALITYIRDDLQPRLPEELFARTAERVYLNTPQGSASRYFPDVRIVEEPAAVYGSLEATAADATQLAEPVILQLDGEHITEGLVEIVDAKSGGKVITAIEVLSPSNKTRGEGWRQYVKKRDECRAGGVNFVEVDLLRQGEINLMAPEEVINRSRQSHYRVCVWRAANPLKVEFYPISLRQRLPAFRIPLRSSAKDISLDLQPLLGRCYESGKYRRLDYTREPEPPLDAADAHWADELLRGAKLRA